MITKRRRESSRALHHLYLTVADDAGALLVRSGLVSASALDDARAKVASQGGTIGEQLVALGAVADDALTDFYRSRLLVPQVNPNTLARLSAKVVSTIPGDMAIELRAVPVSLDQDNNLTVAMSDPSDRHAVDEISFFTGTYVVRAVATQMQIAWCLAHYYGHVTSLGQRLIQPSAAAAAAVRPQAAPEPAPRAKGLTAKVEAARHRAIAPVTAPVDVQRPGALDDEPAAVATAPGPAPEAPAPDPVADGVPQSPRARSASGEIRVPVRRAASIRPPLPEPDDDESGPVITVEAMEPDEDSTGPRMLPARRKVKTDPPELAARAGEVSSAGRPDRAVDDDQPRIIIEDDLAPPPQPAVTGELRAAASVPVAIDGAEPSVTIEVDDASVGVVIHDYPALESEPVLLERRRRTPSDPGRIVTHRAPSSDDGEDTTDDEVVVLEARKPPSPVVVAAVPQARPRTRSEKRTQVGFVPPVVVPRRHRDTEATAPRAHRDTEASGAPSFDDAPARAGLETDPTRVDQRAAPAAIDEADDPVAAPPSAVPVATDEVGEDTSPHIPLVRKVVIGRAAAQRAAAAAAAAAEDAVATLPRLPRLQPHEAVPQQIVDEPTRADRRVDYDPVDDGWGPPGTTIPPPLLGALPGSDDDRDGDDSEDDEVIPLSNVDAAPLIVAPPSPPEPARGSPAIQDTSGPSLVRALEVATSRSIELIHALERAQDRDGVVSLMISHLGETHRRAGFFSIRNAAAGTGRAAELAVFAIQPVAPSLPSSTLRLDRPSTLQDVVGTRLPYRGPMHDDASRTFLASVLGACPPEILLVPVTVRERVVGVLFGEHRMRHTFDDQLALAARAAGMALERILKAKRG